MSTVDEPLRWHCACGETDEEAQPEYEHGDWEKSDCSCGRCFVVTLKEAAAAAQAGCLHGDGAAMRVLVAASERAERARATAGRKP